MHAAAVTELEQEVAQALEAAGFPSYRGGMKRGRSGFWIASQGRWVKVFYAAGPDEMACTDYARSVMLPQYAEALRAAGFANVGVTCTQLAGEWVQAGNHKDAPADDCPMCQ
jgi:hypothetical protein